MQSNDLEKVMNWRNHPSVRQNMLTQHLITMDEHQEWFERTTNNSRSKIMLVEHEGDSIGLVHFTDIELQASTDWGFYVAPDTPKGSGQRLGKCALAFAFRKLQVHKVLGKVVAFNSASIRFHESLGFSLEGRLREQVLIPPSYHDLLCFGLLVGEWSQISNS